MVSLFFINDMSCFPPELVFWRTNSTWVKADDGHISSKWLGCDLRSKLWLATSCRCCLLWGLGVSKCVSLCVLVSTCASEARAVGAYIHFYGPIGLSKWPHFLLCAVVVCLCVFTDIRYFRSWIQQAHGSEEQRDWSVLLVWPLRPF